MATGVRAQAMPDTPPESILEVGQPWRQGPMELTLARTHLIESGVLCLFKLVNLGPDVSLRYTGSNFSAADSLQRPVQTLGMGVTWGAYVYYFPPARPLELLSVVVPSGGSIDVPRDTYSQALALLFDPSDPEITEVVVTVSGISRFSNARWRVPVAH
jgi:hypothetical protein